jgi:hypothetical protein
MCARITRGRAAVQFFNRLQQLVKGELPSHCKVHINIRFIWNKRVIIVPVKLLATMLDSYTSHAQASSANCSKELNAILSFWRKTISASWKSEATAKHGTVPTQSFPSRRIDSVIHFRTQKFNHLPWKCIIFFVATTVLHTISKAPRGHE